jgi:hypothetical protein
MRSRSKLGQYSGILIIEISVTELDNERINSFSLLQFEIINRIESLLMSPNLAKHSSTSRFFN